LLIDIHRNPSRLILAEQLGCRSPARLILEIDIASFCQALSFTSLASNAEKLTYGMIAAQSLSNKLNWGAAERFVHDLSLVA
jgi:hypothetical protein